MLPEAVRCAHCSDKRAILAELARGFASAYGLDEGMVLDALREREALGSTGFGRAVAIPHARLETIEGVATAQLSGERLYAMRVWLDPAHVYVFGTDGALVAPASYAQAA